MSTLIDEIVNAFLQWKLPDTVCSDLCATDREYAKRYPGMRCGTNLLTADEARQMVEHVFGAQFTRMAELQRDRAALSDKLNGTPCAEIRWRQEREALIARIAELETQLDEVCTLAAEIAAMVGDQAERLTRPRRKPLSDNRKCCNPSHLRAGDAYDNMADAISRNRLAGRQKNNNRRLKEIEVKEIINNIGVLRTSQLAEQYAVTEKTIRSIRNGTSWQRIPR